MTKVDEEVVGRKVRKVERVIVLKQLKRLLIVNLTPRAIRERFDLGFGNGDCSVVLGNSG